MNSEGIESPDGEIEESMSWKYQISSVATILEVIGKQWKNLKKVEFCFDSPSENESFEVK